MQLELSEQEAQHIEKCGALNSSNQDAVDLFMERIAHVQSEIDRAEAERKPIP